MYSWSSNLSQMKNSFGKVVFQILAEIEMTRNEIGYLAAFWNGTNILYFLTWYIVVISVYIYIYGIKINKKFRWESGFLKEDSMQLPLKH